MISMSYACKCGFESLILSDAQKHADTTQHSVGIRGFISPKVDLRSVEVSDKAMKQKAYDQAIMRAAREKGLVK